MSLQQVPFGVVPAVDIIQQKINEIFTDLPKVFDIVDDILIVGYSADDRDHDNPLKHKLINWININVTSGVPEYHSLDR